MNPADTLVSASGQNVEQLLQRAAKRRAKAGGAAGSVLPTAVATVAGAVLGLPASRRQAAVGACGAAAVLQRDAAEEQEGQEPGGHAEPASVALAPATADPSGDAPSNSEQAPTTGAQQHGASLEEEDEEEWEDAWEDDEEVPAGNGGTTALAMAEGSDEGQEAAGPVSLTFDRRELLGGVTRRRPRNGSAAAVAAKRGVSKADRFEARLVHRSTLLCQLARGLLHDAAADDPLLQSLLLSMVPQDRMLRLDAGGGTAGGVGAAVSTQGLHQQLSWFRETFSLSREPASSGGSGEGGADLLVNAFRTSRGSEGLAAELAAAVQEAAAAKRERRRVVVRSAELYATLFAALLRAQGAAVRLVAALTPAPLRPTGAAGRVPAGWPEQPR